MNIKQALQNSIKTAAEFKAARYNANSVEAIDAWNAAPNSKITYAILPTKDKKYDVLDNNKNVLNTFDDYESASAFARNHKFASGEAGNPFTQALAKILSGRVPVSETQTLKGPAGDISSNKSDDESIGNVLMRLNPAQALNRALGE